jgi:hypothetical protein
MLTLAFLWNSGWVMQKGLRQKLTTRISPRDKADWYLMSTRNFIRRAGQPEWPDENLVRARRSRRFDAGGSLRADPCSRRENQRQRPQPR